MIFLVAVMIRQDWVLTLVAFVGFPTAILPIARLGKRMRKVSAIPKRKWGSSRPCWNKCSERRHVKSYAMEGYETGRAQSLIDRLPG